MLVAVFSSKGLIDIEKCFFQLRLLHYEYFSRCIVQLKKTWHKWQTMDKFLHEAGNSRKNLSAQMKQPHCNIWFNQIDV